MLNYAESKKKNSGEQPKQNKIGASTWLYFYTSGKGHFIDKGNSLFKGVTCYCSFNIYISTYRG
jgi:hypothetical protein